MQHLHKQTLFQHIEIISFLITICASEETLETQCSAVTDESIAEVIR